jgi:Fic family protein
MRRIASIITAKDAVIMSTYLYELADWPQFSWESDALEFLLADIRFRQGQLIGRMVSLGFPLQEEAAFLTLTEDVLKTSAIEGEHLDQAEVRSSIARRLGIDIGDSRPANREVDGIVEVLLDAVLNHDQPLTVERLFRWHAALFPTGRSGFTRITTGAWRSGPMQVVSNPYGFGQEQVHFEAPPPDRLDAEMSTFLDWFNASSDLDLVLKSAIAHLWFVTIHPFDDGNGRIARAISDLTLARSEQSSLRFYSMSSQIQRERAAYYMILEQTQKGTLDITDWLTWYLDCLGRAIDASATTFEAVLAKSRFWNSLRNVPLNDRQRLMLNRLIDGFEGKLTTGKWAKIARTSQDTALRDITDLVERGILTRDEPGGRSTSYSLTLT